MGYDLELKDRVWTVSKGETVIAEIYLDYCDQVDEVVLSAASPEDDQLAVLRLAASHVQQYVKYRTVSGGLMVAEYRDQSLSPMDSLRLMDFDLIPEGIRELDHKTIVSELRKLQVAVTIAVHQTADEAIRAAVRAVGVRGLRVKRVSQRRIFGHELGLEFSVRRPDRFIFWKSESKPLPGRRGEELHIVPAYHPVMNDWEEAGMVNGHTDAYISSNAIQSLYAPRAARSVRESGIGVSSWNHLKHPFYATGQDMGAMVIATRIRSAEGVADLTKLLSAALGQGQRYVAISGGFQAPMKCAHNRLLEIGRPSPWPRADHGPTGNVARGSEEHCVWAYRTLKIEGALKQASVPPWFIQEGWLDIYKGAEVRPKIF